MQGGYEQVSYSEAKSIGHGVHSIFCMMVPIVVLVLGQYTLIGLMIVARSATEKSMTPKEVNRICVTVQDNDFYHTLWPFLEALKVSDVKDLNEEYIVKLWDKSCLGLYYLYQNRLRYASDDESLSKYLQSRFQVYLNEEIAQMVKDRSDKDGFFGNCEYFFLNLHTGEISCV